MFNRPPAHGIPDSPRSLDLKSLFVMALAPPQQAQADDAIHYDHDSSEHSVAC